MQSITALFGAHLFDEVSMRERLPKETFESLKRTMETGCELDSGVAAVVANAMKDWAIEQGATHFTHWFQPMTGTTAGKHDAFLSAAPGGRVIMEFSGKELVKGEPDASSFPSGGLRATFEARGYTTWDPTSFAFVRNGTLHIPTAFCAYSGEALDKKTPLLRSMQLISAQALRVLHALGHPATRVSVTVGPEQEYFLVDKAQYNAREDLRLTGRTLFGARPPKGQELEDHYFGTIKERVALFMKELDEELWKLGVYAKTKHNEVAPAQHELAPIFTTANIATDDNQIVMEMMRQIAPHHGLECLLHEKPFAGVNGSGKHNNWSLVTDTGENLLKAGKRPSENTLCLLMLCAVMAAVDKYGDLLRMSAASPGNNHRLGGHEAPPAIVSMYLGGQLTHILEMIEQLQPLNSGHREKIQSGVTSLPVLRKDGEDRNRTSPMAFTGDKFEFRMVGAPASIADVNTALNTAVADTLCAFAGRLEGAENAQEMCMTLIRETYAAHKRVVFNGNNYSAEWVEEAARRGLPNLKTMVEAAGALIEEKNRALFTKYGIFTEAELYARHEMMLEHYAKTVHIEALTMLDMVRQLFAPAVEKMVRHASQAIAAQEKLALTVTAQRRRLRAMSEGLEAMLGKGEELEAAVSKAAAERCAKEKAQRYNDDVQPAMDALRAVADALELMADKRDWPIPTYSDLLFAP